MKREYVLGVDGGNTKTHYFLYDGDGNFVDGIEAGTCSHEALSDSFAGTRRELGRRTEELFSRNGIGAGDIGLRRIRLGGGRFRIPKKASF